MARARRMGWRFCPPKVLAGILPFCTHPLLGGVPFAMSVVVLVGALWGDEAKGKLADFLSESADIAVRYNGGHNAGHTVQVDGQTFKFHLIPVGILHSHCTAIIAGGMVVCPKTLLSEWEDLEKRAPNHGRLVISGNAQVLMPYHPVQDELEESARGVGRLGTTSRGIGPAYQDKVGRFGIRMADFVDSERFRNRLKEVLPLKNRTLSALGGKPFSLEEIYEEYRPLGEQLSPFVGPAEELIWDAMRKGAHILLEGAHGTMLDLDHGTYPFVTSSHPVSGGACLGTGIPPQKIDRVIGVCAGYATRVGNGPFPTELFDETGDYIRERGREYGTTTGRPRRCGWLDLVLLRYAVRLSGFSALAITRLDVLSGLKEIGLGVHYLYKGRKLTEIDPGTPLSEVKPVIEVLRGWEEDLSECRKWEDLPGAVKDFVQFIESSAGVPVVLLSVGPSREQTIVLRKDLLF